MSAIVRAAAVQISPVLYSREGTVEKVIRKIRELGKQGVRFATFPETIIPYYPYFSFVQPAYALGKEHQRLLEQSVTIPSAETDAIGEAAREAGMVVSIGVNERDGGTIYNTQLLFDADGTLVQRRRKITPTYHERMIWGQGDGSGLRAVDSAVGRIGQLACWEHYLPLARYALMADGEQIHSAMYPGSIFGPLFAQQTEINVRQHALEFGLLRRQRHRVARCRSAGADCKGYRRSCRADFRRLLHGHHRPRRPDHRRTAQGRRRRGDRGSGLRADRRPQRD